MAKEVFVKRPKGHRSFLNYKGTTVNLCGEDVKQIIKANTNRAAKTIEVKGATQEILRDIFDNPKVYGNWPNLLGERDPVKKK